VICCAGGRVEEFYGDPLHRSDADRGDVRFQILIARTEIGGYCSH